MQPAPPSQPRPDRMPSSTQQHPTTNSTPKPTPPPPTSSRPAASRTATAHDATSTTNVGRGSSNFAAGNAVALARQSQDVQQDVEFYSAVAMELPDCPALPSLLYTHRNEVGGGPSCDEQLAEIEDRVRDWKHVRQQRWQTDASVEQERQMREHEAAVAEQAKREEETQAVLARMNATFESMEASEEDRQKRRDASTARIRQRGDEPQQDEANAKEYCAKLAQLEQERRARIRAIDEADQRGKLVVEETLNRGLCLTDEERGRLDIAQLAAAHVQQVRVLEEAFSLARSIESRWNQNVDQWLCWGEHLASRCGHMTELMRLKEGFRARVSDEEGAARTILALQEARGFETIFVDGIEVGVKSPSRRRLLDEAIPSCADGADDT